MPTLKTTATGQSATLTAASQAGKNRSRWMQCCRQCFAALFTMLLPAIAVAELVVLDEAAPALSGRLLKSADWPGGKVALLLHGTLSHRDTEIIQSLETLLGDEGVSTLAVNLSLCVPARDGAFDCGAEHRHREQDATAELARWGAWLETQGVGDFTLIGHSRGANQIARYVLEEQPATARRLVLIAPPRWSEEGTERAYAARHGAALTPLRNAAQQMVDADNGAALLPQPAGLLYCADARVSAESFLSYYRPDPLRDTPTLLARITLPTLVIAGSEDSIATDLPGAFDDDLLHVRVEEIDGADHFFRDLYADELVEIAIDFIHEYDD